MFISEASQQPFRVLRKLKNVVFRVYAPIRTNQCFARAGGTTGWALNVRASPTWGILANFEHTRWPQEREVWTTLENAWEYYRHHITWSKGLGKKSHESHNLRIGLSTAIFSTVVISLLMMYSLHVSTRSLLGLQTFLRSDFLTRCDETAK